MAGKNLMNTINKVLQESKKTLQDLTKKVDLAKIKQNAQSFGKKAQNAAKEAAEKVKSKKKFSLPDAAIVEEEDAFGVKKLRPVNLKGGEEIGMNVQSKIATGNKNNEIYNFVGENLRMDALNVENLIVKNMKIDNEEDFKAQETKEVQNSKENKDDLAFRDLQFSFENKQLTDDYKPPFQVEKMKNNVPFEQVTPKLFEKDFPRVMVIGDNFKSVDIKKYSSKSEGRGRHMLFPYTITAKIIQFPFEHYFNNSWMWRYYIIAVVACIPVFMYFSSLGNILFVRAV